jgi:hypothetical protein
MMALNQEAREQPPPGAATKYMIDAKRSPAVRLSLSLIASMLAAVIGLFLVRCLATASWLHANNEVAGNYLQTVRTIYAVLLAFVVFVVWQQHNDARSAVEGEANELSDLYRTIRALPGTPPAQDSVQKYGKIIVDEEWMDMARGRWSLEAERALEGIWHALQSIEPRTKREEALYAGRVFRDQPLGAWHPVKRE